MQAASVDPSIDFVEEGQGARRTNVQQESAVELLVDDVI